MFESGGLDPPDSGNSMQRELRFDSADLRRPDQTNMRDTDGVQWPVETRIPKIEELVQHRKFRRQIVVLPDVRL